MSDLATTIDTYLEAYGEPDAAKRAALIQRAFAEDGRLIDPPARRTTPPRPAPSCARLPLSPPSIPAAAPCRVCRALFSA